MPGMLIRWLTTTAAIVATAYLLDGIQVSGFFSAVFAAAVLGILNAVLRPLALLLTLPINILSLGLFTFIINALMLKMASGIIPGFGVYGFWTAIFGSLLISFISWLLNSFVSEQGTVTSIHVQHGRTTTRAEQDDTIDLEHKGNNRWD
ncbi:MAG: phage holin family protein [Desulfobacterales bacterium]|nr:phage holin family protein [Desulfobacterales bacterium]